MVDVSDYRAYADHTRIPFGLCLETRNLVFVSQRNRSDVLRKIKTFVFESLVSLGQTSKEIKKELVFELCIVLKLARQFSMRRFEGLRTLLCHNQLQFTDIDGLHPVSVSIVTNICHRNDEQSRGATCAGKFCQ